MKKQFFLFMGLSGSGKEYFYEKIMPKNLAYKVRSMTTRNMREGEIDGEHYFFVNEKEFFDVPRATTLFVNEPFWTAQEDFKKKLDESSPQKCLELIKELMETNPFWLSERLYGKISAELDLADSVKNIREILDPNPKWLYGVPESEVTDNPNVNLIYDVIEPRNAKQMIEWLSAQNLGYDVKILHFQPPKNNFGIAAARANMVNDIAVRKINTSDLADFWYEGMIPDFQLMSSATKCFYPVKMVDYFNKVSRNKNSIWTRYFEPYEKFRVPENMKRAKIGKEWFWVNDW